ncbi:DUF4336 domain-containing protein [Cyanobium sp. N5-Cardenillas]|uniref:DUF4336 domain-containing protein n=1 Tax=Cyanobium sp. N5-Cardenillas TaxID=2823720 RepID=UPI0020CCD27A|nr:DUF4336 domain-containing protein [Cyanobium sp. N5-Cardenillas]MCP9785975.1 DUF4336 domain-containing protein [Cyanobium sp. N5-Cardenillas]
MLHRLADDLWVAEQPQTYFGLSIGTRMTVIRLANSNRLVILSPIQPHPALEQELAAIGVVTDVMAPNVFHHLYLQAFQKRFPLATTWGPPALRQKCPHLQLDRLLSAEPPSPWPEIEVCNLTGLHTLGPTGPSPLHEVAFCHTPSRTLILTDSAFHFDASAAWLTRLITRIGGGFNRLEPTILERLATSDRASLHRAMQLVLQWDFDRVIVAHGAIVETGGKQALARAYSSFLESPLP